MIPFIWHSRKEKTIGTEPASGYLEQATYFRYSVLFHLIPYRLFMIRTFNGQGDGSSDNIPAT